MLVVAWLNGSRSIFRHPDPLRALMPRALRRRRGRTFGGRRRWSKAIRCRSVLLGISSNGFPMSFKAHFADVIAAEYALPDYRAYDLLMRYHTLVADRLAADGQAKLPHIGVLRAKERRGRMGINPATGLPMEIRERLAVKFSAAKDLVARLNGLERPRARERREQRERVVR